jgi:hypothetical protein
MSENNNKRKQPEQLEQLDYEIKDFKVEDCEILYDIHPETSDILVQTKDGYIKANGNSIRMLSPIWGEHVNNNADKIQIISVDPKFTTRVVLFIILDGYPPLIKKTQFPDLKNNVYFEETILSYELASLIDSPVLIKKYKKQLDDNLQSLVKKGKYLPSGIAIYLLELAYNYQNILDPKFLDQYKLFIYKSVISIDFKNGDLSLNVIHAILKYSESIINEKDKEKEKEKYLCPFGKN